LHALCHGFNYYIESKVQTLTGNQHLWRPHGEWPWVQCILRVPSGVEHHLLVLSTLRWSWAPPADSEHPCREVCVCIYNDVHALCLLKSNTELCPLFSGCSLAETMCSWHCLCIWWLSSSRSLDSLCHHIFIYLYNTLQSLLGWLVDPTHATLLC
jgi:hypothetical protein